MRVAPRLRRPACGLLLLILDACAGSWGTPRPVAPGMVPEELQARKLLVTTVGGRTVLEHTYVARDTLFGVRGDGVVLSLPLADVLEVARWRSGTAATAVTVGGVSVVVVTLGLLALVALVTAMFSGMSSGGG